MIDLPLEFIKSDQRFTLKQHGADGGVERTKANLAVKKGLCPRACLSFQNLSPE
jgi:hypothetical protein